MNGLKAIIPCMFALALAGCADLSYDNPSLGRGQTRAALVRSIDAMGGLERLTDHSYRARAVIVQHGTSEPSVVWQVRMEIDPAHRTLVASAPTGKGTWRASIRSDSCSFDADGYTPPPGQSQAVCDALKTVLHRVSGPLNFMLADEQAQGVSLAIVDGQSVSRVGVRGGQAGIRAYYFDLKTRLPQFVTAYADAPDRKGTVTVYQWQTLPGGVMFPKSIRVMEIGRNMLVGMQPTLEVDFQSVKLK